MEVHLDRDLPIGLSDQLQAQVRLLIEGGRLEPGALLPTARALAEREGVNVNTVAAAYKQLEAQGYVVQRRRAGTRVAPEPPTTPAGASLAALAREVAVRARELGLATGDVLQSVAAQAALRGVEPRFRVALLVENALQATELRARAAHVFPDDVEILELTPDTYASEVTHLTVVHPSLTQRLAPSAPMPHHLAFDADFPAPAD